MLKNLVHRWGPRIRILVLFHSRPNQACAVVQKVDYAIQSSSYGFCNGRGIIVSAEFEDTSFVGGCGGILPKKIFKFEGSEMLYSALVMRYVSEKSTLNMKMANNCKSL